MRFCPFCAAKNQNEATQCAACARRLPALPGQKIVDQGWDVTPIPEPVPLAPEASERMMAISGPPTPSRSHLRPDDELPVAGVAAMPEAPEGGLVGSARYVILLGRARWARRGAIRRLQGQINEQVAALDTVLGNLGASARAMNLDGRAFVEENRGIDGAERRREESQRACAELGVKKTDEHTRYDAIHRELSANLVAREGDAQAAARHLEGVEAERKALRERRKDLERRQRGYRIAAEQRDTQAEKAQIGDTRAELRRAAEELRKDVARLQPEREDAERRLGELEVPLRDAQARSQEARASVEAARRALEDAREGHRHRVAELEAELAHKSRELAESEAEIARRLVTLGTLVNLHRTERPELAPHFEEVDRLRAAIALREREIDRLNAERAAFDRPSVVRGAAVLGAALIVIITLLSLIPILL